MCKWNKWGDTRIDPCMREIIKFLNRHGTKTIMCCCGHSKYNPSIIVDIGKGYSQELFFGTVWYNKKRFYKKDKQGYYYIPELKSQEKGDE